MVIYMKKVNKGDDYRVTFGYEAELNDGKSCKYVFKEILRANCKVSYNRKKRLSGGKYLCYPSVYIKNGLESVHNYLLLCGLYHEMKSEKGVDHLKYKELLGLIRAGCHYSGRIAHEGYDSDRLEALLIEFIL